MIADWPKYWHKRRKLPSRPAARAALRLAPGVCLWCRGPAAKDLCSDACRREWRIRAEPFYARMQVADRDGGKCAFCGAGSDDWHVDHIIAVQDGGGCYGLENLRTLCHPCHLRWTAATRPLPAPREEGTPLWRDGSGWTKEQDESLLDLRKQGKGYLKCANELGRTKDAIRFRLRLLEAA